MTETSELIDRKFIPSLREGVDVVRMIFFKELKVYLGKTSGDEEESYAGMMAGAIMNEFFGTPNPLEKFASFAAENRQRITDELGKVNSNFPELCIVLTDALRIHFLSNHQEGIGDDSENERILARAKDYGILLAERDVPLPKGFMELVYRVGKAHGLIVEQNQGNS